MFHLIGFIVTGFVIGLLARAFMPGKQNLSILVTTLVGIAGALLAGWLGRAAGWYGPDDGAGFLASAVGAVVVLAIYMAVAKRRTTGVNISDRDITRRAA